MRPGTPSVYAAVLLASLAAAACGGSDGSYRVPTETPLRPYQAPESDDLVAEDAEPIEESAPAAAPPPAATPAPAAAPAPAPAPTPK